MYMAYIGGYNPVIVFNEDEEKAKQNAVNAKCERYFEDLDEWTWKSVTEFYGGYTHEVNTYEALWL